MLLQLHVKSLATIEDLHLEFQSGTTVLTGETGAGKSILIDAIELALGKRATIDMIRTDREKADISLCFDVSQIREARDWLKHYDLNQDSNECIIRRTIHRDGRSRSFINGLPTTLQPLRELSELLIQIHGQHEHQSLLKPDMQRRLLDRYANHQHLVDSVWTLAEEWQTLHRQCKALKKLIEERNTRGEFLKFQLQELETLHLTPDLFYQLDLEHKQLANAGELIQNIQLALQLLTDTEEHNAIDTLNQAVNALETIRSVDPKISSWLESIRNAIICISDTEDELRHYLDTINLNPERLNFLDQRIRELFDLARKHKVPPHELYELQQKLSVEYRTLEASDARLDELNKQLEKIKSEYFATAKKLTQSRRHAANQLVDNVHHIFKKLSLDDATFHVEFEEDPHPGILCHGLEKIIFYMTMNRGQRALPLAKIVSGGELSRISLSIHLATADIHCTPSLIFDEVDVGISGGTTEMVGKLLRQLGQSHQVFCITHQPLVAAHGHHHIQVTKLTHENKTETHIKTLMAKERVSELARMLGGIQMTKKTLAHAQELIEKIS